MNGRCRSGSGVWWAWGTGQGAGVAPCGSFLESLHDRSELHCQQPSRPPDSDSDSLLTVSPSLTAVALVWSTHPRRTCAVEVCEARSLVWVGRWLHGWRQPRSSRAGCVRQWRQQTRHEPNRTAKELDAAQRNGTERPIDVEQTDGRPSTHQPHTTRTNNTNKQTNMTDHLTRLPNDLLGHLFAQGWLSDREVIDSATCSRRLCAVLSARYELAGEVTWYCYRLEEVQQQFQLPWLTVVEKAKYVQLRTCRGFRRPLRHRRLNQPPGVNSSS